MIHYLRKHTMWLLMAAILCSGAVFFVVVHAAGIEPKLINFQAHLTDSQGNPLQGTQELTFRLWDSETGGTVIWAEMHPHAMVINGNVSVLLGSNVPLTIPFDLAQDWYLGISVGSAPEMTPRQHLLPSHHSVVSSRLVVSHPNGSRSEFGANEIVPVGGIITYFGDPGNLPGNWKVCDGRTIADSESPFDGQNLPDMTDRFVRGIGSTQSPGDTGGQDSDSWSIGNHAHAYSVSIGNHTHTLSTTPAHKHSTTTFGDGNLLCGGDYTAPFGLGSMTVSKNVYGYQGAVYTVNVRPHLTADAGEHSHTMNATGGFYVSNQTQGNGAASGTIQTVPRYVSLYYIIRVK